MFKQLHSCSLILRLLAIFLIAINSINALATGLNALEMFLKSTRSGKAEFSQVVTSPAKTETKVDGVEKASPKVKTSAGTFEFLRPNRFKFQYKKPFEQTIVADGTTLWLYDVDLNQVTARKQAHALGSTPAALIATAPSLKALEQEFTLQDAADANGLQWVLATPKAKEGQLQSIRVGLKTNTDKGVTSVALAALEILDSFGQRSALSFSKVELNPALSTDAFNFKPPVGADVIRQ